MDRWEVIEQVDQFIGLTKEIIWSDSFLIGARLFTQISLVESKTLGASIANTGKLPNAWIGILTETDQGFSAVDLIASQVEQFSIPITLDDTPELVIKESVLKSNRVIQLRLNPSKSYDVVCHSLAFKTRKLEFPIYETVQDKSPSDWESLCPPF